MTDNEKSDTGTQRPDVSEISISHSVDPNAPGNGQTVHVVVANYDGDPHPHVEGVFADEDRAQKLDEEFQDPLMGSKNPIAWTVEEMEVQR